jgi:hypothetical protein
MDRPATERAPSHAAGRDRFDMSVVHRPYIAARPRRATSPGRSASPRRLTGVAKLLRRAGTREWDREHSPALAMRTDRVLQ